MTQQLDLLRGSAPAPRPASAPKPQPAASNTSNPVPAAAPSPAPMAAHGPFKPIAKGSTAGVTAQQQKSLDALIERYVQRTRESKRLTALHREYLADPRSVSGFKLLWKEMVYPFVTPRSDGSKVWDVDGNEYVDFVMGFGASLFGHRPPFVTKAVQEQTQAGFEIGPISPLAGEVAALMREFTGQERFGFTNTGTEAVLAAVRVARTVTGRDKIAVFAGAYHGIGDEMLFRPLTVNGETRTAPIAPGIPDSAVSQVIVLDYCNPQSLEIIRARGSEIAAVLVETVQSRRLDLQPEGFLQELRKVTDETGSALIFDEVVWGFRLNPGGAAAHFGVRPDLATYGKVVGGGLPIGIVGGCAKYMDALDGGPWQYGDSSFPEVGVTFFAGTFVRHPLALAAAKAVLTHLKQAGPDLQRRLSERTAETARKMRAIIEEFHAPYHLSQFSSLMHLSYPQEDRFASLLYYYLRERGIHIWDNRAFVLTTAHTDQDLAKLCRALRESLAEMRTAGFLPPAPDSPDSKTAEATSKAPAPASPVPTSGVPSLVSAPSASAAPGPAGSFPLTEAQKEIWLAAQMGGDASVAYNESLSLDFHGPFDADVFRAAVREVVQRHPILLARIDADGESQHIDPGTELELPLLDFRDRDQAGRERELAALVDREISTPFDLAKGPFLRVHVARLTPEHHAAVWTAHHIVCDGWSLGVLMNELGTVYSARKQGLQPVLPVPVSFRQFAIESGADSTEAQEAVAYWKRQFAEVPLPLDLPTDRPRPSFRSAQASTRKRVFDAALYQSLKRTASQQRTTLVVLLMAGLDTLLHRLTGQTDVVLGLGVAGQAVSGNNSLVGHCLNTLPVRARLEPDASFQHNLAAIRGAVLDAYEHHQCTIGGLLQHLQVPRSAGRPPLIEVLFNVDRDPAAGEFLGAKFTCDRNAKRALHFDLFFNFVESAQGLYLECDYNTDLFDASTMDRWMAHYRTLLESIARDPAETLAQLAILTPAEQQGLLADPNRTDADFPEHRTLPEWFQRQASRSPDARAVAYEGIDLTYAGLNGRANQVAHHLREMGVGPDVLVGVCLERSLDMVVALLGILKAGGAYVPLDPAFPQDRLGYMVEDSRMPVLITHRDLDRMLPVRPERIVRLDADWPEIAARASGSGPWHSPGPEHLAYVLYTSGSTGKPKGVEIPHRALVNFLASMQRQPGFTSADRLLAVTTLSFDIAGLELYLPLVSGGSVFVASTEDAHDPIRLMERMREARCNVMQATPATWRALIDAGWSGAPDLKILCGGEAFPRDLAQELLHRSKEVWNMYGPTETTIWSTLHKVTSASGAIPIGHPIANTQVVLLDAHRNLVPPGAIGELCIGGAGLARGYLRRPELTEDRFIASPFHDHARLYRTGDLARWLPGNIIECLGRVDNQVKVRGFRIELGEIETVLAAHEAIRQCVVVAREDRPGDKVLVAYFEPRDEHPAAAADLRAHLKKDLPEYMVPSLFVPLDKLPLTPNGKIDRKALPAPASENLETSGEFLAPEDSLEQMLALIFSKILRVKRVGRRDNFFELGGHSLAAVRLLSDVRKATGKNLPLATLFQASSVEALSNILRQDGWQPSWSSVVPMRVTGSRPPLFLIHGAEGNVLLYEQLVRNLGPDQPVYGLQSQGLNGEAPVHSTIQEMAARYREEILTVQPQGPYHLGGYCLGGTIAFEMAQQLVAAGHEVGLVALLDTYNEGAVSYPSVRLQMPLHVVQNLWYHGVNFFNAPAPDRGKFLRQKIDIAVDRSRIRLCAVGHALLRLTGRETPAELPHLRIKRANDQASMEYRPQPYRGRVAVFRPRGFFAGLASPSLGWEGVVTSGLEIHELPVYPKGMLIEPFCRSLAQAIASCLSHGDGGDSQAPPANGNGLHRERPESTLVS